MTPVVHQSSVKSGLGTVKRNVSLHSAMPQPGMDGLVEHRMVYVVSVEYWHDFLDMAIHGHGYQKAPDLLGN